MTRSVAGSSDRLRVRANPLRALASPAPWLATLYLLTYPLVGTVAFVLALTAAVVAMPLAVTWLLIPALALGAWVIRRCADAERLRYRLVGPRIRGDYYRMTSVFVGEVRRRWTDAATWRDLGYLVALYPVLLALDLAALLIWLVLLALVTCPIWYWSIPQELDDGRTLHGLQLGYLPDGPGSSRGFGVWVDSVPAALLTALVALVLLLGCQYVVVGAARLHRHAARVMLGPRIDPLADLRRIAERRPSVSRSSEL